MAQYLKIIKFHKNHNRVEYPYDFLKNTNKAYGI